MVWGGLGVFCWFLGAKPCRIMWKLHQQVSFEIKTCEIGPEVGFWSCPGLLLTEKIKKPTGENLCKKSEIYKEDIYKIVIRW